MLRALNRVSQSGIYRTSGTNYIELASGVAAISMRKFSSVPALLDGDKVGIFIYKDDANNWVGEGTWDEGNEYIYLTNEEELVGTLSDSDEVIVSAILTSAILNILIAHETDYDHNLIASALQPADILSIDALELLNGPAEANATADQTGAEIKGLYEGEANTNAYTDAEKSKLAGLDSSLFLGVFVSLAALQTAHPSPLAGSNAYVDTGVGEDIAIYVWDATDSQYVLIGSGGTETAASIKTKYESNADTNAFTDTEKTKLGTIETNASDDQTGSEIKGLLDTELGYTDWRKAVGIIAGTVAAGDDTRITSAKAHADLSSGNPHGVTAADVELDNVDNTADVDKPISTATQTALDAKATAADLPTAMSEAIALAGTDTTPRTIASNVLKAVQTREKLTVDRTYYVRKDGSDSNTGLSNNAGGAFLTIQHAVDVVCGMLDMQALQVTIQIGDGTYTEAVDLGKYLGAKAPILQGNSTNPRSVIIDGTPGAFAIGIYVAAAWTVKDLKMQNGSQARLYVVGSGASISPYNIVFGGGAKAAISVANNGVISSWATTLQIDAASTYFIRADYGGVYAVGSTTITITAPASIGQFVYCVNGTIRLSGCSFVGSSNVTGQRYFVALNGAIDTTGAGETFIPGTVAGTKETGGQYA